MNMRTFHTPILFLLFNRKETAIQVFTEIRKVQPSYLFLAADGGRDAVEHQKCLEVRETILSMIDWECELQTNFRDENAGCGKNVSEAITWFFDYVEEGIILEDDCVPHESFFLYCAEMLEKYRHVENIYMIGGNNFQNKTRTKYSYYFSIYGHIWGWATWRRAWNNYHFHLSDYDVNLMRKALKRTFKNLQIFDYWWNIYKQMTSEPIDTWDYQWSLCQWYFNGLSIMPNVNLVKNIGFGEDATHTKNFIDGVFNKKTYKLDNIRHPKTIDQLKKRDKQLFYKLFKKRNKFYFLLKLKEKLFYLFNNQ